MMDGLKMHNRVYRPPENRYDGTDLAADRSRGLQRFFTSAKRSGWSEPIPRMGHPNARWS